MLLQLLTLPFAQEKSVNGSIDGATPQESSNWTENFHQVTSADLKRVESLLRWIPPIDLMFLKKTVATDQSRSGASTTFSVRVKHLLSKLHPIAEDADR